MPSKSQPTQSAITSAQSQPARLAAQNLTLTAEQRAQWAAIAREQRTHNPLAAARLEFWRLYEARITLTPGDWS